MGWKAFDDIDIGDDFVLPKGSVTRGQLLFKKHCSQCHTIRRDGLNPYGSLLGPSLYGVMGRTAGQNQRTGWAKYSEAVEASGILWTENNMMKFLKNPRAFAGGAINMNFRGLESLKDRVDIVHYLKRAGHEDWMVQDGIPHSQRNWWKREGTQQTSTSYWQLHAEGSQLKPYQHVTKALAEKAGEVRQAVGSLFGGSAIEALATAATPSAKANAAAASGAPQRLGADDPELQSWRRVSRVVDGVQAASIEQGFNWPLPEEISAGPVRRRGRRKDADVAEAHQQAFSSKTPAGGSVGAGGVFAPSGLIVYVDQGGPAVLARRREQPSAAKAA